MYFYSNIVSGRTISSFEHFQDSSQASEIMERALQEQKEACREEAREAMVTQFKKEISSDPDETTKQAWKELEAKVRKEVYDEGFAEATEAQEDEIYDRVYAELIGNLASGKREKGGVSGASGAQASS